MFDVAMTKCNVWSHRICVRQGGQQCH
uniref:Uncharacterized protein n=1 Tax=Arundo donax TaxID=35708 RepID=A0A0A9GZJ9_ARUDO